VEPAGPLGRDGIAGDDLGARRPQRLEQARRSSVSGLKARPSCAILRPRRPPSAASMRAIRRGAIDSLTAMAARMRAKSPPASSAVLSSASVSLGKQEPP
jgi:hypothetical protein